MRILVLGGTVFLSRAVAAEAVGRGHDVVCSSRGVTGEVPDGARLVTWDRTDGAPPPAALLEQPFDAVVDVARHPSWVRTAVAAFPGAHRTFVSTVNVYADDATPGQTPTTGRLREPQPDDVDPASADDAYGRMKVACESVARGGADGADGGAFVVRPGLIVGPGDPTGRFTYWPERLADVGHPEVIAPGDPADVVQVVDVRDLAAWIVDSAEDGRTGTFDAVGEPTPIGELLETLRAHLHPDAVLTWVPSEVLEAHGVQPWSGPDAIPLWLPRPAHDGMLAHDPAPAVDAGLRLRPITETADDVLTWLAADPAAARTGWSRPAEAALRAELLAQGPPRPGRPAWDTSSESTSTSGSVGHPAARGEPDARRVAAMTEEQINPDRIDDATTAPDDVDGTTAGNPIAGVQMSDEEHELAVEPEDNNATEVDGPEVKHA